MSGKGAVEMLKTALEMEEKGFNFYEQTIKTCKNPLGTEIFTTLRNDELLHKDRIKAIYKSMTFYQEYLKKAASSEERGFLEKMVTEEQSHAKVLEDTRFYLKDPASWFAEKERSGLDGQ